MRSRNRRCGRKDLRSQFETVVRRTPRRAAASSWRSLRSSRRLRMWWPRHLSSRGYGYCGGFFVMNVRLNLSGQNSILNLEFIGKSLLLCR